MSKQVPRLRNVDKSDPAFPTNQFPKDFPYKLGREIVYLLATKQQPTVEGSEWEQIFAICIGAEWKPSNIGLDDVVLKNTAWGAKSVKAISPSNQKTVRLISGRNSPVYSYGGIIDTNAEPNKVGESVLDIWNGRVSAIREKYPSVRTVVLIKSEKLSEVVVFEFETIRYDPEAFEWQWNLRGNLEGVLKGTVLKKFVWQPHGSQFTIIEEVPKNSLIIKIQPPEPLDKKNVLTEVGFDNSWITVSRSE